MGLDHLGLSGLEEWLLDFVEDILTHDVVIQLGFAFAVKAEPPHLALDVTKLLGLVPIVLGTALTQILRCSRRCLLIHS